MWGWLFAGLGGILLLYICFLKRKLRTLANALGTINDRSCYGGRLHLDTREKNLTALLERLNTMIDRYEQDREKNRQMEQNLKFAMAGLSHDLRTPLTAIGGYIQLLQKTDDPRLRERFIATIERSVNQLLQMTNQFYDLALLETEQSRMRLEPIELDGFVEEIFFSCFEQFQAAALEVEFAKSRSVRILGEPLMLTRVIQNIIQNNLRYSESLVRVSYQADEDTVRLIVENDLKPESEVAVEQVFERFYTENLSRTTGESSGLGLFTSKKIIENMGGTMTAEIADGFFQLMVSLPKLRV